MFSFKEFIAEQKTTLEYHSQLNPKLWDKDQLKPEVRKHLLEIASAWRKFANIPANAVKDILFTGGNANYNYTSFSDIDVHLLVNKKQVADCEKQILDDYLKDKKTLWAVNHDIKIYGYNVELYAQDIDEPTSSNQGVFSLQQNKWIRKPEKVSLDLNDKYLLKKIKNLKEMIDYLISTKCDDMEELENLKKKLRDMRAAGIQKSGEFSVENLAFKELRNRGYLDKLTNYIKFIEDKKFGLYNK